MITNDYKNGVYKYDTRKSKSCATYNGQYTIKDFFIETLAGIAGAAILLTPIIFYICL